MSLYGFRRSGVTMAAGADVWAIITAANRRAELWQADIKGNGGTSAAAGDMEAKFGRCTAPTGGAPTTITTGKEDPDAPAAASTCAFGHTTPSATFLGELMLGGNYYSGLNRWLARARGEIKARNGEAISLQQVTGTGSASFGTLFDEI